MQLIYLLEYFWGVIISITPWDATGRSTYQTLNATAPNQKTIFTQGRGRSWYELQMGDCWLSTLTSILYRTVHIKLLIKFCLITQVFEWCYELYVTEVNEWITIFLVYFNLPLTSYEMNYKSRIVVRYVGARFRKLHFSSML